MRRAKWDGIDAELLLRTLLAWLRGEPRVCSMAPVPNEAENSYGAQVLTAFQTSVAGRSVTVDVPVANPAGVGQSITLAVLPNGVGATIAPASHAFAPFEQIIGKLHVTVPAGLHNTNETVSVIAHDGSGALIGGASLIIWVDD
jgi:transposase